MSVRVVIDNANRGILESTFHVWDTRVFSFWKNQFFFSEGLFGDFVMLRALSFVAGIGGGNSLVCDILKKVCGEAKEWKSSWDQLMSDGDSLGGNPGEVLFGLDSNKRAIFVFEESFKLSFCDEFFFFRASRENTKRRIEPCVICERDMGAMQVGFVQRERFLSGDLQRDF